jgi:hypothetical protein
MANKNHINPDQLRMFMSAREIDPDTSVDAEEDDRDSLDELLGYKLDESKQTGLYYDIGRRGVQTPIQVIHDDTYGKRVLGHGNHRFAAQRDINPDALIPVVHTDAVYDEDDFDTYGTLRKYKEYTGGKGVDDAMSWQNEVNWDDYEEDE